MIALRNEFTATTRRADAKIGLLKEIIEKIQRGEEVDVEGLLGTGDKQREAEWEEGMSSRHRNISRTLMGIVLKEIEKEDEAWERTRKRPSRSQAPLLASRPVQQEVPSKDEEALVARSKTTVGFY